MNGKIEHRCKNCGEKVSFVEPKETVVTQWYCGKCGTINDVKEK